MMEDLEKIRSRYDIFKMTGEGDCKVFGHIKGPCVCRAAGRKRCRQRSREPSRIGLKINRVMLKSREKIC